MRKPRVAILHYHLRGGGVTRIIEHTVEALKNKDVELCIITGEEPGDSFDVPEEIVKVVKGLSYGNENPERDYEEMVSEVKDAAKDQLGALPDVWHVHNHSLGKNAAFTRLVLRLAEQEHRMLFHIHDFAEDNRAKNYRYLSGESSVSQEHSLAQRLYPLAPNIHYAVLNGRDQDILADTGIKKDQLHLLSNPVSLDLEQEEIAGNEDNQGGSGKLYLYPCRVIPRKNIGEFLLWSALAGENEHFAVTLAPKNPKYHDSYNQWKKFAEKEKLPVTFEAGQKWDMSFPELLNRADAFITTSIAEGFGLIYLESWLAGKPLTGRILPDIVADFRERGIQFPGMYEQVKIPVAWISKAKITARFRKAIQKNLKRYGIEFEEEDLSYWINTLLDEDKVDFGALDEEIQRTVIARLRKEPALKEQIQPVSLSSKWPDEAIIEKNKAITKKEFSLSRYAERLLEVYDALQNGETEKVKYARSSSLLKRFQSPQNFSLLRT
ncbi:glycosyltransferase family 4 protein [Gracilimonas mengyeensis]|uniref:Glycosyltransferase involved in cell wall bisynthesis n=1 Tax=Gracilimonas mengyeensis TaxID=1302730 RepID=A0A521BSZ9_9BACT|nr:glycosyltransferase family 4 protein [Gracilimonas mengyeensis]SMO49841.1 Glycosyltransferase involved in cell wall bisynthesis [Gracilimonas mengyeensis]